MTTAPTPSEASVARSDLERLFLYMRDFEMAYLSGEWSVLDSHFCDDARHEIVGGEMPLGTGGAGRRAELPIFCVFETGGGAIASERFFFDLAALCEQIGLPVAEFSAGLRGLREQGMAA